MVGGRIINYPSDVIMHTADLTTAKCLFSSTISTPNTCMVTADISNSYLNTMMDCDEYMHIPINDVPPETICDYKLTLGMDNFIYVDNGVCMGSPKWGCWPTNSLQSNWANTGTTKQHPPGLWKHQT